MNNTTLTIVPPSFVNYYQYIGFGSAAVLVNFLFIALLIFNPKLLKKCAFMFGLAIGDLLDGLSLLVAGILRIQRTNNNTIQLKVHPSVCMMEITPIFILGNQIPGIMFFVIGFERFLAIKFFGWYHNKWSDKMAWLVTAAAYGYATVSLAAAYIITFTQPPNSTTSYSCGTPSVMGDAYIAYNYSVSLVGGTLAAAITIASLIVFNKRKSVVYSQNFLNSTTTYKQSINKQYKVTKTFLVLSLLDFSLVAVPNFLAILNTNTTIVSGLGNWTLQIICARGSMNFFIYMLLNKDIRTTVFKFVSLDIIGPVSAIGPTTNIRK